jgi:hypothetical protein
MAEQIIKTISPEINTDSPYVVNRNQYIARSLLSSISGRKYEGEHQIGEDTLEDILWVPHFPISKREADLIGIKDEDHIFGGIAEYLIRAEKTIIYPPIDSLDTLPIGYIKTYSDFLKDNNLRLDGYTVFSVAAMSRACEKITNEGNYPRVKFPFRSGEANHYRIDTNADFANMVKNIDHGMLQKYGAVVEPNMINPLTKMRPKPYSAGRLKFNGQIYSYVGNQIIERTGSNTNVFGTEINMVKGSAVNLRDFVNEELNLITEYLLLVQDKTNILPDLISTRTNLNFIKGVEEKRNKYHDYCKEEERIVLSEETHRVGAATFAEAQAMLFLKKDDIRFVNATSKTHFGKRIYAPIGDNVVAIKEYSSLNEGDIQTWVEINEVI